MATTIKLKNSVTTTNTPTSLVQGEVAINITDKKVWVGNAATTPIQLLGDGASLNFTSLSLSGNLTFTGTGNRITGDFSTAPPNITNRVMIQSSTTNGQTGVIAIPNGTSTAVQFEANSDSAGGTNGSIAQLAMVGGSDVRLVSGSRGTGTNLPLTMLTGGSERLRIDTSGNLLVGTTTTRNKLTVSGTATTTPTLGTASGAALFAGTDLGYGTMIGTGSSGNGWIQQQRVDGTGTAYDLLLQPSGGNVGIGTSSPSAKLDLGTTVSKDVLLVYGGGSGSQYGLGISGGFLELYTSASGQITFNQRNGASYTERMRIDSSGNVGISTSSPTAVLQVFAQDNQANKALRVAFDGTYYSDITENALHCYNNPLTIETVNNFQMAFKTNATERMRITSAGDVGIGTTSPSSLFHVAGGNIKCDGANGSGFKMNVTVNSGADRDMFLAGISGVTNGFTVQYVNSGTALSVKFASITTTASAANAFLDSGDANRLYRSTSSLRYKKDIENIEQSNSDAVLNLRPVWYRSKADNDKKEWSWYGLIAEEVAEIEPRLVHWTYLDSDYDSVVEENGNIKKTLKEGAKLVPDGVQYERVAVLLLDVVKRQEQAIEELKQEVAKLKGV